MIKNFEFENYKAFQKGSINVKPITIFIGGNSSGKSSITHLPLLFYQTLNNRLTNRIQGRKNIFDINGSVIQMGNTKALIKNKDINNILSFKFSFTNNTNFNKKITKIIDSFHESIWETVRIYSLFLGNSLGNKNDFLDINSILRNHHKWNMNDKKKFREQMINSLKKIREMVEKIEKIEKTEKTEKTENLLLLKRYSNSKKNFVNRDEIKSHEDYLWSSELIDVLEKIKEKEFILGISLKYIEERRDFFVKKISIIIQESTSTKDLLTFEFDHEQYDLINVTSSHIKQEAISKYKSSLNKIFNFRKGKSIFDLICKDPLLSNDPFFPKILRSFLDVFFDAFQSSFSESAFNYVGPLRDYPRQYYLRTENRNSTKMANFMLTEILIDNPDLLKKVNYWLNVFSTKIEIDETNENIRRIKVIRNNLDCDLDISNIGFGVSQILPVIIETILSQSGSITIIEQPELHLHPNMQGMLVDFFIDAIQNSTDPSNIDKKLIIETHSSMLLNRLRLRIAQNKIQKNDVAIYTFSVNSNNDGIIKEVSLRDKFNFDWPTDFIEEELNDSIELSKIISKELL